MIIIATIAPIATIETKIIPIIAPAFNPLLLLFELPSVISSISLTVSILISFSRSKLTSKILLFSSLEYALCKSFELIDSIGLQINV